MKSIPHQEHSDGSGEHSINDSRKLRSERLMGLNNVHSNLLSSFSNMGEQSVVTGQWRILVMVIYKEESNR